MTKKTKNIIGVVGCVLCLAAIAGVASALAINLDKDKPINPDLIDIDNFSTIEKLYLNRFIDKAYNSLTSNIGYVFTKIKENKIDEITYFSYEEENNEENNK